MFSQVKLPYSFSGLEPAIDSLTMETHYGKHHAAYTKNFNEAATKAGMQNSVAAAVLANLGEVEDLSLRTALRNNGGGFYNHNLYFSTLSADGGKAPGGSLGGKIVSAFGSFEKLQEVLTGLAMGQFGSGWAFLSTDSEGELHASASPNQDNPIIEGTGWTPIMCIDVWEHAYYLKYKNLRGDYIKALFSVIDWDKVEENYRAALG